MQGAANGEELPFARSIRIGAKPKVSTVKKAKPVERIKGPVTMPPDSAEPGVPAVGRFKMNRCTMDFGDFFF